MLMLTADDVRRALPMPEAITAMRDAFTQLAEGRVEMPLRTAIRVPERDGVVLVMPARCDGPLGIGAKIVSVFPGQPIHAVAILLDAATGRPAAVIEGRSLTAIRTGAVSGLATELLARPDASRVAVIGSGVQARTQLEAVCTVRKITAVVVYSPTTAHAERFAHDMAGTGAVPATVDVAPSARHAVEDADVVCAATTSATPVFQAEWVPPGTHVNAVGSFTPEMRELDPALLGMAVPVVDQRAAAMAEAGEVIAAVHGGLVDHAALIELGDVVIGRVAGRTGAEEITVFKSVGLAVQDVVAGAWALAAFVP
jgi:ornithine cyclodeaminase/alanine dehydrogenase-like protein (mu-crystallin family)